MKEINNKLTQKFDEYPTFGVLQGVKVFVTGTNIAGPFAGSLMAEMGAKVLQAEAPSIACQTRGTLAWSQNHRNEYSITINVAKKSGQKIFLKCIEWADIWIEAGRPSSYAKRGLTEFAGSTTRSCLSFTYLVTDSSDHRKTNRLTTYPDRQWVDICT